MEFVLRGFHQDGNLRRYRFEGITDDRKRSEFTVGVDLSMARNHRIPMQELPLLCRGFLETQPTELTGHPLVFTEEAMMGYASRRAAEQEIAGQKRKNHRPPLPARVAAAPE